MGAPKLPPGTLGSISATRGRNGKWRARARLGTLAGAKQVEATAPTRRGAIEKLQARPHLATAGGDVSPLVERFINRSGIAPQTRQRYETAYRLHLAPTLAGVTVGDLTPLAIETLLAGTPKGVAPTVRTLLHGGLDLAVRYGELDRNPVEAIPKPQTTSGKKRPITPSEFHSLRKRLTKWENTGGEIPLTDIALFMAVTGVRPGEMLALTWDNVNLTAGTVDIVATQVYVAGSGFIAQAHTKRAKRTRLILPPPVVDVLNRRYQSRPTGSPWVFHAPRAPKQMINQPNLNRAFRLAKGENFKWVTWRTFRYTVAQLVAKHAGLETASKALTHTATATTRGSYLGDGVELAPNVTQWVTPLVT